MSVLETAVAYQTAKVRAGKLFCQHRLDRKNPRILVRYVRALRACARLQITLKEITP